MNSRIMLTTISGETFELRNGLVSQYAYERYHALFDYLPSVNRDI
jgi:hypothetical protein